MPSLFKPQIVRYLDKQGKRVPRGTPGACKVVEKARKWWGKYRDHNGHERRVPLYTDKAASRHELGELVQREKAAGGLAG
jgi:hypothetical protein